MRAHPLVNSYSIIEENSKIILEMCMSYDRKPFYITMTGTDIGVNSTYVECSDVQYDGGYYDVTLTLDQASDVYDIARDKLVSLFKKRYSK